MFTPSIIVASVNSRKLPRCRANTPTSIATAAHVEAILKPRLRPKRRMIIVAGTVVPATATTISDSGRVTNALFAVS